MTLLQPCAPALPALRSDQGQAAKWTGDRRMEIGDCEPGPQARISGQQRHPDPVVQELGFVQKSSRDIGIRRSENGRGRGAVLRFDSEISIFTPPLDRGSEGRIGEWRFSEWKKVLQGGMYDRAARRNSYPNLRSLHRPTLPIPMGTQLRACP